MPPEYRSSNGRPSSFSSFGSAMSPRLPAHVRGRTGAEDAQGLPSHFLAVSGYLHRRSIVSGHSFSERVTILSVGFGLLRTPRS
jgi:hypothetical protein